jgi:cytochrome c5
MRNSVAFLAAALAVASCAHHRDDGTESDVAGVVNGEAAYAEHCAGCHETGMLGAPREGAPEDWEARSSLWQAVLMEHARTGYFDMPARGGKTHLPDEVVNAAAEFMLEQTFPNRPED